MLIALAAVQSEAQSLGDVARKERARQQGGQSRIKITNDSVNYPAPVPVIPAAETDTSRNQPSFAEQPPALVEEIPSIPLIEEPSFPEIQRPLRVSLLEEELPPVAPPAPPLRDEKWWRSAFQEARDSLKRAEDQVIALQVALDHARLDQLEAAPGTRRTGLAAEVVRLTNELGSAQKDAANARRTISELEEDLRQSGGLPAWTR